MVNFYPGPSKINEKFLDVISEITRSGLSSFNHRSETFSEAYKITQQNLKTYLSIPDGYEVVFLSSATECWEVISRQFKNKTATYLTTGAFSLKWYHVAKNHNAISTSKALTLQEPLLNQIARLNSKIIAYTDCETSNGYKFSLKSQEKLRQGNPESLIIVDATSSLGGTKIDFLNHDITFCSVQKCIGFPPGLAVVVLSPIAIKEIEKTEISFHYNDLNKVLSNHFKHQTTHTPNTQLIISLGKIFSDSKFDSSKIKSHLRSLNKAIAQNNQLEHYIELAENRSENVICLRHIHPEKIINKAWAQGFILGKGYGNLCDSTFRIANFPAHSTSEIKKLCNFISTCTT